MGNTNGFIHSFAHKLKHSHSHGHGHSHSHGHAHGSQGHGHSHMCPYARPKDGGRPRVSADVMKWGGRASIIFATFGFIYGIYGLWRCVLIPYGLLDLSVLSFTWFCAILFHCCVALWIALYYYLVFSDPGYAPKKGREKEEERPSLEDAPQKNKRWCTICESAKPRRAHHCRHCQRCVMRMDHHCPWINNCVGHNNIKNFTVFLVYGAFDCIVGFILFLIRAVDLYINSDAYKDIEGLGHQYVTLGVLLCLSLTFSVALGGMTASQLILITSNTTTIERLNILRKEHFRKFHKRGDKESQGVATPATSPSPSRRAEYSSKNKWDNKYNLGVWLNLKQVFGDSYWTWAWPRFSPATVDGSNYPTNNNK